MTDCPKLAGPAQRTLKNAGIDRSEDLASMTAGDLAELHGMGPSALKKISAAMAQRDLAFTRST